MYLQPAFPQTKHKHETNIEDLEEQLKIANIMKKEINYKFISRFIDSKHH